MATPLLSDRVTRLEESIKPLQEFRAWGIAIIAGGILTVAAGAMAWGSLIERLDHVSAEVQDLRQDLRSPYARTD